MGRQLDLKVERKAFRATVYMVSRLIGFTFLLIEMLIIGRVVLYTLCVCIVNTFCICI